MDNKRYQIVYTAKIWTGLRYVDRECLCTVPTESGDDCIVIGLDNANRRVTELHKIGILSAYYELLPSGTAWFDDENWLG